MTRLLVLGLDGSNSGGSYERFGRALKILAAKAGQDQIVLTKNCANTELPWGKEDGVAIKALEAHMPIDADFRETRQKLNALLVIEADRLTDVGERVAFELLMRALHVLPDAGEGQQKRPASYKLTPRAMLVPNVPPSTSRSGTGTGTSTGTGGGTREQVPSPAAGHAIQEVFAYAMGEWANRCPCCSDRHRQHGVLARCRR